MKTLAFVYTIAAADVFSVGALNMIHVHVITYIIFVVFFILDTRETAFVHAVTAAGVVFTIGKACGTGSIKQCMCDAKRDTYSRKLDLYWRGCQDDADFGYLKSKEFMDMPKKTPDDLSSKIRRHNNEVGRLAVTKHMKIKCKCHGWNIACMVKTCWKVMPSFSDVGSLLKDEFERASKVSSLSDSRFLEIEDENVKPPSDAELLYADRSPTFCEPRKKLGSLGTQGRKCNPDSMTIDGCDLMCCSRGYNTTQITVQEECHCEFIYCCEIKCDTCTSTKNVSRCF